MLWSIQFDVNAVDQFGRERSLPPYVNNQVKARDYYHASSICSAMVTRRFHKARAEGAHDIRISNIRIEKV